MLYQGVPAPKSAVLARAKAFQQVGGGKAIGGRTDGGLEIAQRLPCFAAKLAVRSAAIEPARGQELLQLQPLRPRQFSLLPRPALNERLSSAQAIGEMTDRKRIGLCGVVLH